MATVAQVCEEWTDNWNKNQIDTVIDYFRNFLYLPVLLINDDLFELELSDNDNPILKRVESSRLVFNYHYNQRPQTTVIFVITKNGLADFLTQMLEVEATVENNMIEARKSNA